MHAFVAPTVGYFHGVIDYYGAVGPSGVLRDKFWDFRRTNLFFDAFEARIGAVKHPQRNDPRVRLEHHTLTADYWLDTGDGVYFVGIVNESSAEQHLALGALTIDGVNVPRYVLMTVPHADYPGAASDGGTELEYSAVLASGLPLLDSLSLGYSTAEVLTLREHNGRQLLVVFGSEGAEGELAFAGAYDVVDIDGGIENRGDAFTFRYGDPKRLTVSAAGEELDVLVLNRDAAGRTWFHRDGDADYAVVGPDYVSGMTVTTVGLDVSYEHDGELIEVYALTPAGETRLNEFLPGSFPSLPDVLTVGRANTDVAEAAADLADTDGWYSWTGDPMPLEELGIFRGHAWYRAEFEIDQEPDDRWLGWAVNVEHASDIVGLYVNGTYLTTLAPVGTKIDSRSWTVPTPSQIRLRTWCAVATSSRFARKCGGTAASCGRAGSSLDRAPHCLPSGSIRSRAFGARPRLGQCVSKTGACAPSSAASGQGCRTGNTRTRAGTKRRFPCRCLAATCAGTAPGFAPPTCRPSRTFTRPSCCRCQAETQKRPFISMVGSSGAGSATKTGSVAAPGPAAIGTCG